MAHAIGDFLTQSLWTLLHARDFEAKENKPASKGELGLSQYSQKPWLEPDLPNFRNL